MDTDQHVLDMTLVRMADRQTAVAEALDAKIQGLTDRFEDHARAEEVARAESRDLVAHMVKTALADIRSSLAPLADAQLALAARVTAVEAQQKVDAERQRKIVWMGAGASLAGGILLWVIEHFPKLLGLSSLLLVGC